MTLSLYFRRCIGLFAGLLLTQLALANNDVQLLLDSETDATEEELLFLPLFPVEDIKNALENWRAAWSRRDVTAFVAAYKPGYTSHKWMPHEEWVRRRWENFGKHSFIDVQLSDIEIEAINTLKYTAQFSQVYKSNKVTDHDVKRLTFEYLDEVWVITRVEKIK